MVAVVVRRGFDGQIHLGNSILYFRNMDGKFGVLSLWLRLLLWCRLSLRSSRVRSRGHQRRHPDGKVEVFLGCSEYWGFFCRDRIFSGTKIENTRALIGSFFSFAMRPPSSNIPLMVIFLSCAFSISSNQCCTHCIFQPVGVSHSHGSVIAIVTATSSPIMWLEP